MIYLALNGAGVLARMHFALAGLRVNATDKIAFPRVNLGDIALIAPLRTGCCSSKMSKVHVDRTTTGREISFRGDESCNPLSRDDSVNAAS